MTDPLTTRERFVLYSLRIGRPRRDIARHLGVTVERVRQIAVKAERRLEWYARYEAVDRANPTAIPIDAVPLSVRSYLCLVNGDSRQGLPPARTLGEVAALTRTQLAGRKNLGRKSLAEIEAVLARYGLALRAEEP